MASFNRVILIGNLTRDVEVKYLANGTAVAEIGLAVNDKRKDKSGNWIEEVAFVDITLFGRTAEVAAEYLVKGASCLIEGRLKLDQWEADGQKRSKLKVIGESMQMLGGKSERSEPKPDKPQRASQPERAVSPSGDDIPF